MGGLFNDGVTAATISEGLQGPAAVVIGAGSISLFLYIVRELVRYNEHFSNFYRDENVKLRSRVDELEKEVEVLSEERIELRGRVQELIGEVAGLHSENNRLRADKERLERKMDDLSRRLDQYIRDHNGG